MIMKILWRLQSVMKKKMYSNKMKQKVVGFNSKNLREMKAIKEEHI